MMNLTDEDTWETALLTCGDGLWSSSAAAVVSGRRRRVCAHRRGDGHRDRSRPESPRRASGSAAS